MSSRYVQLPDEQTSVIKKGLTDDGSRPINDFWLITRRQKDGNEIIKELKPKPSSVKICTNGQQT